MHSVMQAHELMVWYRQSQSENWHTWLINYTSPLLQLVTPTFNQKSSKRSPKTFAFAPTSIQIHTSAFLCISSFCLLSPLPYGGKAVLFVYVVPRVQEVFRLVSTISHFDVFLIWWTLKCFTSFVFLTFAATTKQNSIVCSITLLYIKYNKLHLIQHFTINEMHLTF